MATAKDDAKECEKHLRAGETSKGAFQSYGRCATEGACAFFGLDPDNCAQGGFIVDEIVGAVYDFFDRRDPCDKDRSLPECTASNNLLRNSIIGSVVDSVSLAIKDLAGVIDLDAWREAELWPGATLAIMTPQEKLIQRRAYVIEVMKDALPSTTWRVRDGAYPPEPLFTCPHRKELRSLDQQCTGTDEQRNSYARSVWPKEADERIADLINASAQVVAIDQSLRSLPSEARRPPTLRSAPRHDGEKPPSSGEGGSIAPFVLGGGLLVTLALALRR